MMLVSRAPSVSRLFIVSEKMCPSLVFSTKAPSSSSEEGREKLGRTLQKWRESHQPKPSILTMFQASVRKKERLVMPREKFLLNRYEIERWWKRKTHEASRHDHLFIMERHETLGCDLAAAHFLVHRGGSIKRKGSDDWIFKNEDDEYDLPKMYDPNWRLTHIDAADLPLYYEAMENFQNLWEVLWACYRGNPHFDDWCVDKLSAHMPNLEYLDISDCEKVTERSLEALCRLLHLKILIVTNWHNKPSFSLSCTMLEDCLPGLIIKIVEPARRDNEQAD